MNNLNYTDFHDVDEDMLTLCSCGTEWWNHTYAGVFRHAVDAPPSHSSITVASLKNKD